MLTSSVVPCGTIGGMDPDTHAADQHLREDIRRLGEQLGDTLRRQEGEEFLDLVERVRLASKATADGHHAGAGELLAGLDLPTTIRLARAFSSFFHLANLAEQVHRFPGHVGRGQPGLPFVEQVPPGGERGDDDLELALAPHHRGREALQQLRAVVGPPSRAGVGRCGGERGDRLRPRHQNSMIPRTFLPSRMSA